MEFINLLVEYEFLQNAVFVGLLIGFISPIIGVYVVVRKTSMMVESISHISVAGVTLSMLLTKLEIVNTNPLLVALIFAMVGAMILEFIKKQVPNFKEVAVPILISLSTALMILFASLGDGFNKEASSYIFGNLLTSTKEEVYILLGLAIFVIGFIGTNYYSFLAFNIDEKHCKFNKINNFFFKWVITFVISIIVAISIKVVGMLLVSSLVVLPVTSAIKLSNSYKSTLTKSIIISQSCVITGIVVSYYLDIPSGATIIFSNIIVLLFAFKVGGENA